MAFQEPRTGQWAVNPWINGRHIYRTLNPKNLQAVGMDTSLLTCMDKSLAERIGEQYIQRFKEHDANQGNITKPSIMLGTVKDKFLKILTAKDTSRTKLVLEKFLTLTGDCPIRSITVENLDLFRKSIFENEHAKSPFTHFDYLKELNYFLQWSFDAQYIVNHQLTRHLKLRKPKLLPVYLSEDEVTQLLIAVKNTFLEIIVRLILNTGCRRGELIRLKWADINSEDNEITIDGTKTSNAKRLVPLPTNLATYLNTLPRTGEYILTTEDNKPLSRWALSSALRRFKAKRKLPFEWDFQKLRKTYGAVLLLHGYEMATISRFMGHSDIRITQQWYVRLTDRDLFKTVPSNKFEGF
jgi:integrase